MDYCIYLDRRLDGPIHLLFSCSIDLLVLITHNFLLHDILWLLYQLVEKIDIGWRLQLIWGIFLINIKSNLAISTVIIETVYVLAALIINIINSLDRLI